MLPGSIFYRDDRGRDESLETTMPPLNDNLDPITGIFSSSNLPHEVTEDLHRNEKASTETLISTKIGRKQE